MLPSKFKSKFTGLFRQISSPTAADGSESSNIGRSPSGDNSGGCFIQRYLNGESRLKQPDILFGRTGQELPCLRLCPLEPEVIASFTGPDGGLMTVNRGEKKHVDIHDPDVQFIDSDDEASNINNVPKNAPSASASAGQVVRIRAMGQTFIVTNQPPPSSPRPPTPPSVAVNDSGNVEDESGGDLSVTVCEDPSSSPTLSLSAPSSPLEDVSVSCADDGDRSDDYQDLFSSFALQVADGRRQSVTQITSPDDTLVLSIGSESPPLLVDHHQQVDPFLSSSDGADLGIGAEEKEKEEAAAPLPDDGEPSEPVKEIAGIVGWNRPGGMAFGAATSLYERHPISGETAGNPVADAFAVVARTNSALLCLADGVNWGERAALAARSAIHGAMDYLNRALFGSATPSSRHVTTSDIFLTLLRSFHAAHSMILQEGGLLTTLTAAVIAQMDQITPQNALYCGPRSNSAKFVVCVCNVGDSLAYVYSPKHGVREITHGSHDVNSMRDMRDALGALGPVDGQNPELNNLTCSMTIVEEGDIVFLTSDGVSDNFDPVVGKFVVARKPDKIIPLPSNGSKQSSNKPTLRNLPTVEAFQRHELTLLRMEDILRNGTAPSSDNGNNLKAQQLCEDLVDFATRLTTAKRRLLEDPELYVDQDGKALDPEEQKLRRRKICERLALIPGKLDHATVVAYEARIQPPPFRESAI